MNISKQNKSRIAINLAQFSRFSFIGICSNLINFLVYITCLDFFHFAIRPAVLIGYFAGMITSFHYGRTWVLGNRHSFTITKLIKAFSVYLFGAWLMQKGVIVLINTAGLSSVISWLLVAIPTALSNFIFFKYWVFNDRNKTPIRWGGISKLEFLQTWASNLISYINPVVIHNLEKYYAIKKAFYLSLIEDIEGDYIEFGVFEGSSFTHAIRCYRDLYKYIPKGLEKKTRFFGFDSFAGFGELDSNDIHPFYVDEQFTTSYDHVSRRISRVSKGIDFKLVEGFLEETLQVLPREYGIKNARIIFIDTDTMSSAAHALTFCQSLIGIGTILILDDYYSYKGSKSKGVAGAFSTFIENTGYSFREIFSYGMGGKVLICNSIDESA